jgi:isopenicillin N synthase-like dioxygenase
VVAEVFRHSAKFFDRPQEQKDSLGWTTPRSNRGYVARGREKLSRSEDKSNISALRNVVPDLKETMEIGREGIEGLPNRWPDHLDDEGREFKRVMQDFFQTCHGVQLKVMRAIALGLGLPDHFFDEFTNYGDNNLRLLHYPAVPKSVFRQNPDQVRAGEHSDYGAITLLFQDSHGGLQVCSPKGTFVDATPIADTIVINAGDLLARWSNGMIKSTRHRVVEPPETNTDKAENSKHEQQKDNGQGEKEGEDIQTYADRYSVAYFCHPNLDKSIEALPGTYGDGIGEKKYEAINAGDYLIQRLTATY